MGMTRRREQPCVQLGVVTGGVLAYGRVPPAPSVAGSCGRRGRPSELFPWRTGGGPSDVQVTEERSLTTSSARRTLPACVIRARILCMVQTAHGPRAGALIAVPGGLRSPERRP